MTYPTPKELYRASDLLKGYEPNQPMGFSHSWDFRIYRRYIADGATSPRTLAIRRGQAEHDAYISDALKRFLDHRTPRLVGIMGGHGLTRADAAYGDVVELARALTDQGYLIVSGGGPGAMEAAHLGALFAGADDAVLQKAMALLRQAPALPNLIGVIAEDGEIVGSRAADLAAAQHWMNVALEARDLAPRDGAESLGVPTWRYGHEPTVPLASHYAKFFQNSLREEALITNSRAGIVYARGSGGTVREIFEDAERNYYAGDAAAFTPMIFFDRDRYWQQDATFDSAGKLVSGGLKVDDMVVKLFRIAPDFDAAACLRKVRFTTDIREISEVLANHSEVALRNLAFTVQGEPLKVSTAVLCRRAGD
ncbi:hypothetical protein JQ557_14640 [Bradyrhizobium sp. U87765 SZCCT0131]|uniref:hypothetical protein n=1 Tax=unclassified Bradyrhizobium TaxID=2631580 RepID=UPI001BABE989|nr:MULTISPECIES: hypothetical protein [unclassified Bradyrhizobium]MBR1219238.1 hypothetical protein [Bradyrhizobium sp. U87765 SZCCT0131]MBR1261889.1 hypothetical protein [Bradyrhizobium sp. U87765 SZCCT0134]MBR1306258.1 hypothetical protein [Bradyrhizobium sp. U87765 SZCCT0110]MBR1317671.1 hypothetical protein [Bradyrhizobium sp. U87765 SZCCT0109]MBR1351373.1 hypothetical protein [Bradyrhizobium sp. U87765 SZCCT0048]